MELTASPSTVFDTAYSINRAEEARRLAEGMQDANTRILMLGIAESYEVIAKSYEKIAKWKKASGRARRAALIAAQNE
jgi:hypothetical protein